MGDYEDPEPVVKELNMKDGSKERTMESVEGIIIFKPTPMEQAEKIALYLLEEAPKLPGGYIEPNTRATATPTLIERLTKDNGFKLAIANVYSFEQLNIIALKKESKFGEMQEIEESENWENFETLLNPELYEYLTYAGVEP